MFRRLSYTLGCVVLASVSVAETSAQDAAAGSSEAAATAAQRELVQRLGAPSYHAREQAEEELAGQGLAAESALTEALQDEDAEVRRRARRILKRVRAETPAESSIDGADKPEATEAQRRLVQRLGSPSYFARERAQEELANQGLAAEAALIEARKSPDAEIRLRAGLVLQQVREDAFQARLKAFIADAGGSRQHVLPGWKRFRDLVGDSRAAREMFAEMTRNERGLLSAYEKRTPDMSELFADRVAWLQSQSSHTDSARRVIPQSSMATVLLIGSDDTVKDHSLRVSELYRLLCHPSVMQSIGTQAQPPVLRTLLEAWVTRAAGTGASYGMTLALKYNLKEAGLQQATKLLEQKTKSSSGLHHAIIAVGRFGGEEHARLLIPLLENKTVCHRWSNRALLKEGTINVEVRDAALVVLMLLNGQDPKQHGFKLLKENPETLYFVYTFGFINDEEREAAHTKWTAEFKADVG